MYVPSPLPSKKVVKFATQGVHLACVCHLSSPAMCQQNFVRVENILVY